MEKVESRALAKGLELLDILTESGKAVSLAELAVSVALGKASTYRLLQTLVSTGRITDEGDGHYRALAVPSLKNFETLLREAALPELHALNSETGETVSIAVLRDDLVRILESLPSPHQIHLSNPVGRIVPPYASSLGKAIAAWQDAQLRRQMIFAYGIYGITPHTNTDPGAIGRDLAKTRERGYSVEREESVAGGCCFGAPVFSSGSTVRAAVSIAMPVSRAGADTDRRFPVLLRAAARRISAKLGGKVPAVA